MRIDIYKYLKQNISSITIFKILCILALILLKILVLRWTVYAQLGVKQAVQAIEMRENLRDNKAGIYQNIVHQEILSLLSRACTQDSLSRATSIEGPLLTYLDQVIRSETLAVQLDKTYRLYQTIDRIDFEKVWQLDEDDFCVMKYLLNSAKYWLRNTHIDLLQETEIINDFEWVFFDPIYWFAIKVDLLEHYIENTQHFSQRLWIDLHTSVANPQFFLWLNAEQQIIADRIKRLMDAQIARWLVKLRDRWLINQQDIIMLADTFVLEFHKDCNNFHGRYDIKWTVDAAWNILNTETTKVLFRVNVCTNYLMLQDFSDFFLSLVIHEMWHHFYFYHDTSIDDFEAICWSDKTVRNSRCTDNDFVTDYARSMAEEDYAEHFMYWFLEKPVQKTPIMQEKFRHFDQQQSIRQ